MKPTNKRPVVQLHHLTWALIARFDSLTSAFEMTGASSGNIRRSCTTQAKSTASGFRWLYADEYDEMLMDRVATYRQKLTKHWRGAVPIDPT